MPLSASTPARPKPVPRRKGGLSLACWLVLAMAAYQWGLCFAATNLFAISPSLVAATEMAILGAGLLVILKSPDSGKTVTTLLALGVYFAFVSLVRGAVAAESLRDLMIPIVFFRLGAGVQSREEIDRLLGRLGWFVLAVAFLEYAVTEPYLHFFNIQKYYTQRGLIEGPLNYLGGQDVLFNGVRFTGRNILPFLGNLRVSSIFLEPVSMGNFAVILAAWGLSYTGAEARKGWRYLFMAALFIVAADSRFGSLLVILLFAVRHIRFLQSRFMLSLLPLGGLCLLLLLPLLMPGADVSDTLLGRLTRSGLALHTMDFLRLFGLAAPRSLGDMGVAYTLEQFGLPLALIVWAAFVRLPMREGQGAAFRAMIGYYAVSILMVSGTSFYSSKTAALLWFVMGFLAGSKPSPARSPAENAPGRADRH